MLTLEQRAQRHYPNSEHNQAAWVRSVKFLGDKWKLWDRQHRPTPSDMFVNPLAPLAEFEDDMRFERLMDALIGDVLCLSLLTSALLLLAAA